MRAAKRSHVLKDKRIWVLAVAGFAMGTEAFVYAGQLNALASDTGVSIATAGQLTAAFATTAAVTGLWSQVWRGAKAARERIRLEGGGYRRDHLRALAQRVEVAGCEAPDAGIG